MTKRFNTKRISIGAFLVLGTILALYIAIDGVCHYWHYEILIMKNWVIGIITVLDFGLIFPISGLVSTYSYFMRGKLWKVLTKAIIVNIYAWLAFITYSQLEYSGFYLIFIISLLCLGLAYIWKAVDSVYSNSSN